jgi:N-terminal domain of reverse transcriptase
VQGLAAENAADAGWGVRPAGMSTVGLRGIEGAHPGRSSYVRNTGTPSRSRQKALPGRPTARRAEFLGGERMTEKRMPAAERRRETGTGWSPPPWRWSRITGRIPGMVPGLERALTRSGEPVERKMTEAPEPEDKLDATTNVVVNGPEDSPFAWHAVDWRRVEDEVRRLRQRIFTASKAGDLKKVRNLVAVGTALHREARAAPRADPGVRC